MKIQEGDVLLIVDVQNDFINGSLAVPGGEEVVPFINRYMELFETIIFSKDWHPVNHSSFIEQGGPWPPHCVIDTDGAKFPKDLKQPKEIRIIYKGLDTSKDAYSAFEGTQFFVSDKACSAFITNGSVDLARHLHSINAKRLFVCGLATDYCVKATVIDATEKFNGRIFLLMDAIKAVNIKPGDSKTAVREMISKGIKPIELENLES